MMNLKRKEQQSPDRCSDRVFDDTYFEIDLESSVGSNSAADQSDDEEEVSSKRRKINPNGDHSKFLPFSDFVEKEEQFTVASAAQPLLRRVWGGDFNVIRRDGGDDSISTRIGGLFAGVSFGKLVAARIGKEASQFKEVMHFDLLPRSNVWPKSFCYGSGPTEENIAVYFFSSSEEEKGYDRLMFEMISDDLAMRAFVGHVELLVFSSVLLPRRFWRIQGKLYLWGVFRANRI